MIQRALKDSVVKLNPKTQAENPVMFLVYLSAIAVSILWIASLFGYDAASSGYTLAVAVILWFTCLFANFAEAIAEGRGKAQADALRSPMRPEQASTFQNGGLFIDYEAQTVRLDGQPLHLTPIEYKLLVLFSHNVN